MDERKFGEILLEQKAITADQLAQALELQKGSLTHQPLGQLLVQRGCVNKVQIQQLLDLYGKRWKFVNILLFKKFVSMEQLEEAVELSLKEQLPLDKLLVREGFISEANLARAKAIHFDRLFVQLNNFAMDIEPELAASIIFCGTGQRKLVPLSISGKRIMVAMNHPLGNDELRQLEEKLHLEVETVIASEEEIVKAHEEFFSTVKCSSCRITRRSSCLTDAIDAKQVEEDAAEDDRVLVRLVNKIIHDAWKFRARAVHIEPNPARKEIVVGTRIDDSCTVFQKLPYKYKYAIPLRIKKMAKLDVAERIRPQHGKIDFKCFGSVSVDLRCADMTATGHLEKVVMELSHSVPA